jgi:protein ImuB
MTGPEPGEDGAEAPAGALGLRRLRPPRRVEVVTHEGRPAHVRGAPDLDATVVTAAGPWRLSGRWWDRGPWARDEWDVQLADGTLWRLTHDRLTRTWFLDALYD